MSQKLGGNSGSREPDPSCTGSGPPGFDPGRMFNILTDLECALVMTREHSPYATVSSFVDSSIQFKRLSDFLRSVQHETPPGGSNGN